MKNFQKLGSLLLAGLMILSLAACGSKTSNDTPHRRRQKYDAAPLQRLFFDNKYTINARNSQVFTVLTFCAGVNKEGGFCKGHTFGGM